MIPIALGLGVAYILLKLTRSPDIISYLSDELRTLQSMADPSIINKLNIETPEDLDNFIESFKYIPKEDTSWVRTPSQFLADRGGNCQDFAVFTYSVLDALGYQPNLVAAFNPNSSVAHVFTYIVLPDSKYMAFSNSSTITSDSLSEIVSSMRYTHYITTALSQEARQYA